MDQNTITKALWEKRLPDNSWCPTAWVHVYTWRGPRTVIIVTELEGYQKIERRVDGHTQIDGATQYLTQCSVLQPNVVNAALEQIQ